MVSVGEETNNGLLQILENRGSFLRRNDSWNRADAMPYRSMSTQSLDMTRNTTVAQSRSAVVGSGDDKSKWEEELQAGQCQ